MLNCHSQNIIYIMTCKGCNIQYVGEAVTRLSERMIPFSLKTDLTDFFSLSFQHLNLNLSLNPVGKWDHFLNLRIKFIHTFDLLSYINTRAVAARTWEKLNDILKFECVNI